VEEAAPQEYLLPLMCLVAAFRKGGGRRPRNNKAPQQASRGFSRPNRKEITRTYEPQEPASREISRQAPSAYFRVGRWAVLFCFVLGGKKKRALVTSRARPEPEPPPPADESPAALAKSERCPFFCQECPASLFRLGCLNAMHGANFSAQAHAGRP